MNPDPEYCHSTSAWTFQDARLHHTRKDYTDTGHRRNSPRNLDGLRFLGLPYGNPKCHRFFLILSKNQEWLDCLMAAFAFWRNHWAAGIGTVLRPSTGCPNSCELPC